MHMLTWLTGTKQEQFSITSRLSAPKAFAALGRLSRWRSRDGVSGRRKGDRVTLYLATGSRSLLLPVLVAELHTRDGHVVAHGRVRAVRFLRLFLLTPVALWVVLPTIASGHRVAWTLLAAFTSVVFGFIERADRREFPDHATELKRCLTQILAGQRLRG